MSSTIKFKCSKCSATGTCDLDLNITTLNVKGCINIQLPCPACGGALGAPSGYYVKNTDNVLEKVSEFREDLIQ